MLSLLQKKETAVIRENSTRWEVAERSAVTTRPSRTRPPTVQANKWIIDLSCELRSILYNRQQCSPATYDNAPPEPRATSPNWLAACLDFLKRERKRREKRVFGRTITLSLIERRIITLMIDRTDLGVSCPGKMRYQNVRAITMQLSLLPQDCTTSCRG